MAKKNSARRALVLSVLSLILCCSMLVGTTFAWFTDEVTTGSNIIKSGTLDAELSYVDDNGTWQDASCNTIFDYQYWEPGYTQVRTVKVANVGNLAFRYRLNIVPTAVPTTGANLADVIDVYMFPGTTTVDRAVIDAATPAGTLSALMNDADGAAYGVMLPTAGSSNVTLNPADEALAVTGSAEYTIVLKMQEAAGNEYQDLDVTGGFRVQLLATQYTWENDSFDNSYDNDSEYAESDLPAADIKHLDVPKQSMYIIENISAGLGSGVNVEVDPDAAFTFVAQDDDASVQESPYKDWLVDYYVSVDKTVVDGMVLFGSYGNWESGAWYGFKVPAGDHTEPVGLLGLMSTGGVSNWTYADIVSGVGTFNCGTADDGSNSGATLTVQLRAMNPENTSEYEVISTTRYTFK